ncbi:lipid A export permease/ATP-binding protein MsbA [Ectothiorhodospiraceae bacterium WFHF3C12]|nr:lipid A export permease/ATP-binding protein MsbA [Ectothiorhodospiraceae bacterium WFHF3C12]
MADSGSQLTEERNYSGWAVYRRLLGYVRPYWPHFLLATFAMMLVAGTQTASAWLVKPMLDAGFVDRDPATIRLVALGVVATFLVRGVATFTSTYGMAWIGRRVIRALRSEVFDRLLTLPSRFFDGNSSGMLLSKLTYNVEQVARAGSDALTILIRDSVTVVFLIIYMATVSWRLSLIFLAIGPVVALVVVYVSKRFRRISHRIQKSIGNVAYIAEEAIDGHEVVRTFGAQEYERRRFQRANDRNLKQYMKFTAAKAASTPIVQFLAAIALSVVIYLATMQQAVEPIGLPAFVSFVAAMGLLLQPMKRLTNVNPAIQRSIAAGDSIFTLIDLPPERDEGTRTLDRAEGRISFQSVQFAYPGGEDVLRDINLDVNAGERIAIVGRSGSGKSTLVSLLPRFYDCERGAITLDGVPLQEYRLADLRRQIALVGQQVVLFNDTVAANIAYGHGDDWDHERLRAAAEAANARAFIERLPEGFETAVGQNGVLLSGGQRQRLAIARALFKDAPILILDEATSALDTESENEIQVALEHLMAGRTTFVIAHRLSTIENADRIVVMDQGCIVEVGSHSELLHHGGVYATLYRMQFGAEQAIAEHRSTGAG